MTFFWHWPSGLKLNADKTEVLYFGSRQNLPKLNLPPMKINENEIIPTTEARNLGTVFDSRMDMKKQVTQVCKSSHYHIRNIGKIRKYLTDDAVKLLVHAFVTSRIDYCNSLLYGIPLSSIRKLQLVQNTAARLITKTRKYDHITGVLQNLHWLPISERIEFKVLLIACKALHDTAPPNIFQLPKFNEPSRNLRSKSKLLLEIKPVKSSYGKSAFSNAAAVLWNSLPLDIRQCDELSCFKTKVKTHLFRKAFLT
ncbi:uncharacterized protein LOC144442071 [Glandiceps talaboti]